MGTRIEDIVGSAQDAVLLHETKPLLGVTSSPGGLIVTALYEEPAFAIDSVTMQDGKPVLERDVKAYFSLASSAKSWDGAEDVLLWEPDQWQHRPPRAQVAQVKNGEKLLYMQNGGREIGIIDLATKTRKAFLEGINSRAEYFRALNDGTYMTIETIVRTDTPCDQHLVLYEQSENGFLAEQARQSLGDFAAINFSEQNEPGSWPFFFFGLEEVNDDLLMITDRRSKVNDIGIYALDLSDGVVEALRNSDGPNGENERLRFLENTRGLGGNGIAANPEGLFITQYRGDRGAPDNGGPSKLLFLPHEA